MSLIPNLPATRDWVQSNLNPMRVTQRVTAASIKLGGIKPPAEGVIYQHVSILSFSAVTEQEIFLTGIVSESFKLGSPFDLSVLWSTSTTEEGTVGWEIDYSFTSLGEGWASPEHGFLHQANNETLGLHKTPPHSLIGAKPSASLGIRLYRHVEVDTLAASAEFFGVEIEMTIDRLGK